MSEKHRIHVEFFDDWEPQQFFGDPPGRDVTEADCAEQVRSFVEREGLYRLMTDWNILHMVDIWVGATQVIREGNVVPTPATKDAA